MSAPLYMLDTNIVSHMIRFPAGRAVSVAKHHGYDALCISVMTVAELRFGILKRGSQQLRDVVERLIGYLPVMPFGEESTVTYADIRFNLASAGQMIGPVDMFIAAHARSLGLVLVTANVREFARVDGLTVENWLEEAS